MEYAREDAPDAEKQRDAHSDGERVCHYTCSACAQPPARCFCVAARWLPSRVRIRIRVRQLRGTRACGGDRGFLMLPLFFFCLLLFNLFFLLMLLLLLSFFGT